ncbi:MAG: type II toxin-antitoxin system prevent-host-death family antitoxin [Nitrospiraceae bacterium]|nr:type II toxin-antitoxin system prevent-host-death family antitoxin [Nitrospiraceae bacterium]
MKFANIRDLQKDASALVSLAEHGEDVIITKRGKPAAVIYPLSEEQIEEYMIEHSPTIRKKIAEGLKDAREGRVTPIGDLLKGKKAGKLARTKV